MENIKNTNDGLENKNQLAFDFSKSSIVDRVKNRAHAITEQEGRFHPEKSEIGPFTFEIRLSYMGRSFRVKGGYRREQLRSFSDPTFSSTVIRGIRIDAINAFQNDHYVSGFSLHRDQHEAIELKVKEILESPFYNTYLGETETTH